MLPGKQKKVDISSFTDAEKELFQKYGKVPTHKNLLANKLKERKYFDSGDYAMSKAGVTPQHAIGTEIPSPADIPHASTSPSSSGGIPVPGSGTSPTQVTSGMGISPGKDGSSGREDNMTFGQGQTGGFATRV